MTDLSLFIAQAATTAPAAPDAPAQQAPAWASFVPMILIFVAFYFILIRPQSKARQEQRRLVDSLKTGDDVVTNSGILGTVTNVKDRTVIVRIAENTKVEILKSAVSTVVPPGDKPAAA
jgi:preprotein translocase subunit YajC